MANKFNPDNKLSPQELAKHLRQPQGDTGKEVGVQMNKSNKHICLNTYKVLDPKAGSNILEIGMGNGFFVKDLLMMAESMHYTGVDFSSLMVEEASDLNKEFIDKGTVQFNSASIENLPFPDNSFDYITTTNTIYFWPQPVGNMKELFRVLKPHGKVLIAYRSKNCMNKIELTKFGFTIYESEDVENLMVEAGFDEVATKTIKEPELEFDGKVFQMEGFFTSGVKSV